MRRDAYKKWKRRQKLEQRRRRLYYKKLPRNRFGRWFYGEEIAEYTYDNVVTTVYEKRRVLGLKSYSVVQSRLVWTRLRKEAWLSPRFGIEDFRGIRLGLARAERIIRARSKRHPHDAPFQLVGQG